MQAPPTAAELVARARDGADPLAAFRAEFLIPPHDGGEQAPGSGIAALGLDEAAQARLYHGTALEWLGLGKARFE